MDPWRPLERILDDGDAAAASAPRASGRALLCLADIHGDLAALESVLREVREVELCGIVAAGDHCVGGPDPFGVWQRLLALGAHMVRGPSDLALGTLAAERWSPRSAHEEARLATFLRTRDALGELVCRRLADLPASLVVSLDDTSGVMVMHGSPADEYRGLQDDAHLPHEVDCVAEDVLVVGSTHRGFVTQVERLLVVNAGSVGESPVRSAAGERTAHAVLVVPCVDGAVRAFARDIPIDPALAGSLRRAG